MHCCVIRSDMERQPDVVVLTKFTSDVVCTILFEIHSNQFCFNCALNLLARVETNISYITCVDRILCIYSCSSRMSSFLKRRKKTKHMHPTRAGGCSNMNKSTFQESSLFAALH